MHTGRRHEGQPLESLIYQVTATSFTSFRWRLAFLVLGARSERGTGKSLTTAHSAVMCCVRKSTAKSLHSRIGGIVLCDIQLGSIIGQTTNTTLRLRNLSPHEFRPQGQVGQESNRRPAVLEFASFRPPLSTHVH